MRIITTGLLIFLLFSSSSCDAAVDGVSVGFKQTQKRNKFRERDASDDELGFPQLDEDSLLNTKCPRNVELRWKAEVSSSIYATPLIADINSNGRIEVVVPSFVHYLEVLEGSDGDKLSGWPVFHQSKVLSSPLLYDIDKDGRREIALSTYNGVINFFRVSGYMMMDKLEVPHRVVRRNWYTELHPDNVDHLHSDVHDGLRVPKASDINSMPHGNIGSSVDSSVTSTPGSTISSSINASKLENGSKEKSAQARKSIELPNNLSSTTLIDMSLRGVKGETGETSKKKLLQETDPKEVQNVTSKFQANVDAEMHAEAAGKDEDPDVDSSFDLFQEAEEQEDKSNYDYDDYVDESMWGDEEWTGQRHEKMEEYVNIDSHILCTPVIADIDNDGIQDMIVAVSYFFDREYYEKPGHLADLGGINITKYAASSIVVFDLDTRLVKWTADLDLSVNTGTFRAYISSSPTVVDLDGDGNLDILVGTTSGLFYILDHRGKVREKFPLEMAEIKGPVVAADINDDGTIEIVTTDSNGNVAAWNAQGEEIWEVHLKSLISQGPTVGDVNGDGHSDVVIPTMSGNIYVLSGRDGSFVRPFPYRTGGAVMTPVLLVDLSKNDGTFKGLTLVTTSFDGYLYLIDGATACADVVDIGETSYSMVLADNLDGDDDADQDDIDLVVSTMNGNVFCFSTPSPHHPLKEWRSPNQGRNNIASRYNREGIYVSHASRAFRDEGGKHFWVDMEIIDKCRVPTGYHGPYNVTTTLLLPGNYRGERRIAFNNVYDQPGKHRIGLPTVPVQTSATVLVEMVDKNGLYFSDEFSLTFHLHYYALLKWLLVVPMLGMVSVVVTLHPHEGARLPSFSQSTD